MPAPTDFSMDFHAKYVYAYFECDGQSFRLMNIENEAFNITVEDYPEKGENLYSDVDENGMLLDENKLTEEQAKLINNNTEMIKKALSESIKIYDRAYM